MKKILDFCREHRKMCIILGAVLAAILVVAVCVAVYISSGKTDADKTDKTLQSAEMIDEKDKEDAGPTENTDSTGAETDSANVSGAETDSAASSAAGGTEAAGSQADGKGKNGGDTASNGSGASPAASGTDSQKANGNTSSNKNTGESHQHVWENHYTTVTVVDQPERSEKVTEYNMYYWDSKTWQKSEDPNVFKEWERKKMDWMRTYRYENNMPPELFLGNDANGNPQYKNDHSIVTYYRTVPAVTHEEQRVDYQYCTVCGARK